MKNLTSRFLLIGLIGWLLAACGGGGGGGNVASGGTGGTGISFGPISDFGSIFVNEVEFSLTGASIVRADVAITEAELRRGMIVEVRGSIANSTSGAAAVVSVEEAVRGPVESNTGTASAGTLVVLGQTVQVDDTTIIDNSVPDFASISAGTLLEVHGQRTAGGAIAATFMEKKTPPVVFALRGTVANHNDAAKSFTTGALTVNYGGAVINDMPLPAAGNWNGLAVEVQGSTCSGSPVCGTLTATKVEPDGLALDDAAKAEIEGFVTSLVTTADFTVNSTRVQTTPTTVFLGGLQSEIAAGVKLEVEGSLAGGVLTAAKVEFKDPVKLESNAIASGATMTLEGLPGVTVTANAFTEFKNTGAVASNLGPLNSRNVRVRGRAAGTTSVIATEVEDRGASNPNADVIAQGFADKTGVSLPTFVVLGITVNTSQLAFGDFRDVNDNPIGQAAFFNTLGANGGLVKAKGRLPATNALDAGSLREVELED